MNYGAIEFLFLPAFLLLPLPLFARLWWPKKSTGVAGALRVPFFQRVQNIGADSRHPNVTSWWRLLLLIVMWLLLVAAAARPVMIGQSVPVPVEGRDLMLAIDLSGSMSQQDFAVGGRVTDRLSVVKAVADDFISRREGDRIGLVLFGNRAYLQAPLTFDRTVVRTLLDEAEVGLTGTETAIGDALGIAIKRLRDRPVESRVIVLLTDGASNAGIVEPLEAAKIAAAEKIRVYTIGVGADQLAVASPYGRQIVNPSKDLDEKTLQQIADVTGGTYFRAKNLEGLANIYHQIDDLEPISGEPIYLRPSISLFHWPLGIALTLSALLAMISAWPLLPIGNTKTVTQKTVTQENYA